MFFKVTSIINPDVELCVKFVGNKFPVGSYEKILCSLAGSEMIQNFSIENTFFSKIGKIFAL